MSEYESFRNRLALELQRQMESTTYDTIKSICSVVDLVASSYGISLKSTDLVPADGLFPRAAEEYIISRKLEGVSPATIKNRAYTLRAFFSVMQKPIEAITANDVRAYLYQYQQRRGISDRSLETLRNGLHAFFEWCLANDAISKNPMRTIHPIKYEKRQRNCLTRTEMEQLRHACTTDRERAMVEFMYSTGCRCAELCSAKISDIDWSVSTVRLFGKGRKERTSVISARCAILLKTYFAGRKFESDFIFATERRPHGRLSGGAVELALKNIVNRLDGSIKKKITPHVIRHTTATHLLQSGMPLEQIQVLLGHEDINTTRIYAEVNAQDLMRSHARYIG